MNEAERAQSQTRPHSTQMTKLANMNEERERGKERDRERALKI